MQTKQDVINFRAWITHTTISMANYQNVDLNKLSEQELSKFVFDAIKEKAKRT